MNERIDCPPVQVTRWREIWFEGGVLYASFWSGPTAHVFSMGPAMAIEGMALTQNALTTATVLPLNRR